MGPLIAAKARQRAARTESPMPTRHTRRRHTALPELARQDAYNQVGHLYSGCTQKTFNLNMLPPQRREFWPEFTRSGELALVYLTRFSPPSTPVSRAHPSA